MSHHWLNELRTVPAVRPLARNSSFIISSISGFWFMMCLINYCTEPSQSASGGHIKIQPWSHCYKVTLSVSKYFIHADFQLYPSVKRDMHKSYHRNVSRSRRNLCNKAKIIESYHPRTVFDSFQLLFTFYPLPPEINLLCPLSVWLPSACCATDLTLGVSWCVCVLFSLLLPVTWVSPAQCIQTAES